MRSMFKGALVALVAAAVLGAVSVSVASAASPQWEVRETENGPWKTLEGKESKGVVYTDPFGNPAGQEFYIAPNTKHPGEIVCDDSTMVFKGNVKAEGKGEEVESKFTDCRVVYSGGSSGGSPCEYVSSPGQPNGTIALEPDLPTQLVEKEGVLYNEVQNNATSKEIVELKIEAKEGSGNPCGVFKLNNRVSGSFLEQVVQHNFGLVELAGDGRSGAKALEFNTLEADFFVDPTIELESGGELRAS